MAKLPNLFLVLVFVVSVVTASTCGAERRCIDDVSEMALYCQNYLMHAADPKVPPSDECCAAVQKIDVPCLCSFVTEYEKGVSMEKLLYVADYCEKPLKPVCKCGSHTVPPLGKKRTSAEFSC